MKKSLLILPMVAVLGLSGCKKSNGPSAKSVEFEDLEFSELLTTSELKIFHYNLVEAFKGISSISYETASDDNLKENVFASSVMSNETTYYSNNMISVKNSDESTYVTSGGLQTKKTETSAESWTYAKDLNVVSVAEYSDIGFQTSLVNEYEKEEDMKEYFSLQSLNLAYYKLNAIINSAANGETSKFAKDGDDVVYFADTISENYQYAPNRSELDVHSVTREQTVARFSSEAKLESYKKISETLSNKFSDTQKITDDMDAKKVVKDIIVIKYGERKEGQVPEKAANVSVIPAASPLKVEGKWCGIHTETHPSTDFTDFGVDGYGVSKWTSKNEGKLFFYDHTDTSDCLLTKFNFEIRTRKYNAETKKFEAAAYCEKVSVDVSEALTAKGFELKSCTDDASIKYVEMKEDTNLYFSADFAVDANGVISLSNISLSFLTE